MLEFLLKKEDEEFQAGEEGKALETCSKYTVIIILRQTEFVYLFSQAVSAFSLLIKPLNVGLSSFYSNYPGSSQKLNSLFRLLHVSGSYVATLLHFVEKVLKRCLKE